MSYGSGRRYYFDIDENAYLVHDTVGVLLANDDEARKYAAAAFARMIRKYTPDGRQGMFVLILRNQAGDVTYKETLYLPGNADAFSLSVPAAMSDVEQS